MDTSDNPGFVLRNTSLTIRLRFTPAIACSTRTRICASLRLARFSAFVSSRPRGFFFLGWQTWAETAFFKLSEVTRGVAAEAALLAAALPTSI
jgi:hypothetical protein